MGVDARIQVVVGVPWEGPDKYQTKMRVTKKCECGNTGDKTKFCPDCGQSFGEEIEGFDFTPLSPEIQEAFEASWEKWGEDAFGEGIADEDGFGMVRLKTYYGEGDWVLGYEIASFGGYGTEQTETFSGSEMRSLIVKVRGKMDQYGINPQDVLVFHHLHY